MGYVQWGSDMILSAQSIRKLNMIDPFCERIETGYDWINWKNGVPYNDFMKLSHGLGPCSYDMRIDQTIILEPNHMILASTVERINIPSHVAGRVMDKSSWARRGITVQNTHFDPGFRGYLTLELCNHTQYAMKLIRGMAICQVVFELLDEATEQPYSGKYQDQENRPVEAV